MASEFGHVQEKGRSKSGATWRLKINGKYIGVSNKANMDGIEVGTYVEYDVGGWTAPDGKHVPSIDRIRPAVQAPAKPYNPMEGASSISLSTQGQSPPAKLRSALWDDSSLRFISNIVGSAIAAGKVNDPIELLNWTTIAEQALMRLQAVEIERSAAEEGGYEEMEQSVRGSSQPPSDW